MFHRSLVVVAALAAALAVVSLSAAAHQQTRAKSPLPPHHLALADRDRGSVRDRRRQAGHRGRPGLELPEARAADEPLRLRPERRGDRQLPPGSRAHLVQPQQLRLATPAARDQGRDRGGREQPDAGVPADPRARPTHRSQPRRQGRSCTRCRRSSRRSCGACRSRAATCASTTSSTRTTSRRRRRRSSAASTSCSASRTSPTRRTRPAAATRSCRPSTSSRRTRRSSSSPTRSAAGRRQRRSPRGRAGARSTRCSTTASYGADDDVASRWGPRIVQFARSVARIAKQG